MPSYSDMVLQIEELRKQAEKVRKEELNSVIKSIKKQIADYSITVEDLGLSSTVQKAARLKAKNAAQKALRGRAKKSGPVKKVAPKYRDELGNTWTGRGKPPGWVSKALEMGKSLESLLIR